MVRRLEELGLVRRLPSEHDKRATLVLATDAGSDKLASIDNAVHQHVAYLQHQLSDEERISALSIFAFYVGLDPRSPIAAAIHAAAGEMSRSS